MNKKEEFEKKIEILNSPDKEVVENIVRELGVSEDDRAIPILIDMLLKEENNNVLNAIAISLSDLSANEAVPMLINFIKNPANSHRNGSFVYALENLDCKKYFIDIVEMMCEGGYEVYHHALNIFETIVDDASFSEKLLAKEKLKRQEQIELTMPPSKNPKYDRIHFIRDAIKLLED